MASFFDPTIHIENKIHFLNEAESRHICKVLRLKANDRIEVLDGQGSIFHCKIITENPKKCEIEIIETKHLGPPNYEIHIAIAPTKNMDRLEWFIEKATEIGATEFTFLNCENNERTKINDDRIVRILVSAMKQSKRTFIPKINGIVKFQSFIQHYPFGCIAFCGEGSKSTIAEVFEPVNCPILIGPEGDFSFDEVTKAINSGYKAVTLGSNRLRTETAGVVACVGAMSLLKQNQ